jgi:hypothetical protein
VPLQYWGKPFVLSASVRQQITASPEAVMELVGRLDLENYKATTRRRTCPEPGWILIESEDADQAGLGEYRSV